MQNNRFVVLTGHLNNYPLSDLVGILRHQHKSGRLLIEYPKGPATFFFQNGELVDAHMNDLNGLQAICVAMAQPEAAFNFNPLIQTSRRSIEPSLQRVVSELLGCWDESALQIETPLAVTSTRSEPLALPPGPPSLVQQRSVLLIAAAVLTVIGLSTVIAVTGGFKGDLPSAPPIAASQQPMQQTQIQETPPSTKPIRVPEPRRERKAKPATDNTAKTDKAEPASSVASIKVVMQIENGRVLKASVANHKPGMDSYEALALRIARQRRYAPTVNGGETVTISVARPE
jgi:hypothetical protein